ncbi:MAG: hypothetical protein PHR43_02240 [Dehalococcoidales bacterium]|nr:hypothetical protein [Dehalococcoidales bacterium]
MKTIILIIVGAAAALVLGFVGFFLANRVLPAAQTPATQMPVATTTVPSATSIPTPTSASVTPAPDPTTSTPAPTTLDQNIAGLQQAIESVLATGKSREFILNISESEANIEASKMLATATMPADVPLEIKGVVIDFKPGNTILTSIDTIVRSIISLPVTVKVQLQVSIQSGKPAAKATDISFTGSALMPQSVKDQISTLITQQVDALIMQLTASQVAGGKVTLEYLKIDIQENSAALTVLVKPI